MEFRILGPLDVRAGGRALDLGGARQRRGLAALLLNPDRAVPLSLLIEAARDGDPPATAPRQVQHLVAARPLRERLVGLRTTALHPCGRRDEALAAYRVRADRLAEELGMDRSPR